MRILIACIGNIFLGDDGFGVEVARRLSARALPAGVRVVDFGIRGFDLTYALLEDHDAVILVDAIQRGGAPGTLRVIEPEPAPGAASPAIDMHGMEPEKVLALAQAMGGGAKRMLLVGCEPASLGSDEEMAMGLSGAVAAAIEPACDLVLSVLERLLAEGARRA